MASGSDSCAFFHSLTQFFDRAREEEFFKSIIQIPDLPDVSFWMCFHVIVFDQTFGISCHKSSHFYFLSPQAPPNFLRAAALGEYKKPVVVMPNAEPHEEEEVEPQPEHREAPQVCWHAS